MVNRTKISKEISRAAGGGTGRNVGKGTNVRNINVPKGKTQGNINRPGDWIPNPKYRPGNPYSGEAPMIRNPATKNRKKKAERTKASEEIRLKSAKEKARKNRIARLQKETASKADKGRKARQAESEKPRGISVPTTPVKTKTLASPILSAIQSIQRKEGEKGTSSAEIVRQIAEARKAEKGTGVRKIDPDRQANLTAQQRARAENKGGRGSPAKLPAITSAEIVRRRNQQRRLSRKLGEELGPLDDILVEKTGGKVSKSKGGTVKKMHGGKLHKKKNKKSYDNHHGGKLVASLYD